MKSHSSFSTHVRLYGYGTTMMLPAPRFFSLSAATFVSGQHSSLVHARSAYTHTHTHTHTHNTMTPLSFIRLHEYFPLSLFQQHTHNTQYTTKMPQANVQRRTLRFSPLAIVAITRVITGKRGYVCVCVCAVVV